MTHLEQLGLFATLPAEITERARLVLQELPGGAEFDDLTVVEDEDPGVC